MTYEMKRWGDTDTYMAFTPEGVLIGDEKTARYLCDKIGIVPELIDEDRNVCSIGFCERDQKWYGWSHRAIYGFGIGSEVRKGDIAYTASTPEGLIEDYAHFGWKPTEEEIEEKRNRCWIADDRSGIYFLPYTEVEGYFIDIEDRDSLEKLAKGEIDSFETESKTLWPDEIVFEPVGRGEWVAETLDDAREMAIDFARDVA